jgi:hypothetical protein
MWTDSGNSIWYSCQSAYGSGACLKPGGAGPYPAVKQTISSPPPGYKAEKMPWDLKDSFGTAKPIPIPSIPLYFYPGTKPIKALAGGGGGGREEPFGLAPAELTLASASKKGNGPRYNIFADNSTVVTHLRRQNN